LHLLEGFIKSLTELDRVIALIKESRSTSAAQKMLMSELSLSREQATAILDMQLKKLTKLEEQSLQADAKRHRAEIKELKVLLSNERELLLYISDQLQSLPPEFSKSRQTQIVDALQIVAVTAETTTKTAAETQKPVIGGWLGCDRQGRVFTQKTQPPQKQTEWSSHYVDLTKAYLGVLLSNGRIYRVRASEIKKPQTVKSCLAKSCKDVDPTATVMFITAWADGTREDMCYAVLTKQRLKIAPAAHFSHLQRGGQVYMLLEDGDEILEVVGFAKPEHFVASRKGKTVELNCAPQGSRTARGVLSRGIDKIRARDSLDSLPNG
jgi:DNA gyrase subunit A